jgi:glucan 1,3-beta-glucosidase
MQFTLASMDALQDWFFWTWKVRLPLRLLCTLVGLTFPTQIGNSSTSGTVEAPLWSYQLGLQVGFVPTDPRQSVGTCAALGDSGDSFDGDYVSWQTGGPGAGTIAATAVAEYGQWPPTSIAGAGAEATLLPTYTPTGIVETLAPPSLTVTPSGVTVGNGWYDPSDTAGAPTPIAGCSYPNAWDAITIAVPVTQCSG